MGYTGVTVGTHAPSRELDDPDLEAFWEAAAGLNMPVLIHPMHLTDPRLQTYGLPPIVGRTADTTIAASRLICAGVPQRHPELKLILSHGGGTLQYLVGRLERHHRYARHCGSSARDYVSSFRQLRVQTRNSSVPGNDVRRGQGDDWHRRSVCLAPTQPRQFVEQSGLEDTTVRAILVDNARRLFGI